MPTLEASAPKPSSPRPAMSLRMKLTLWTVMISLVIQVSLGLILQLYQAEAIENFFTGRLAYRNSIAAESLHPRLPNIKDEDAANVLRDQMATMVTRSPSLHVLNAKGELVATSKRPGISIPLDDLERALRNDPSGRLYLPYTAIGLDARPEDVCRACVGAMPGPDGSKYYVVMLYNDMFAQQMLVLLRRVVLFSIPVGICATAIAAWVIAGIAVRPFREIRAAAKRLRPESISSRLDMAPMSAEVVAVREELEQARQRIENAFAAQERFMSNVSHELKTPIAVILTEAQNLRSSVLPDKVNDFLRSQREELERLATMVDSFLLLTRVRSGKKDPPAATCCYLRDVLFDSYAANLPVAKQYRVRLELILPEGDDSEAQVLGNADLLRVVFDNITRNAIRFSPEQSSVEISAAVISPDQAEVKVRDHGAGIPPELIPRIFDRFAQAPEEHRRGRGHGLGLEIALGIAELHSGSISVRNCEDGGCEFAVKLPIYRGETRSSPTDNHA